MNRMAPKSIASSLVLVMLALVTLTGCPSTQVIANTPTVEEADEQQATCKVARDPLNPLVVEWPGTAKVDLETASRRGLVAVSYSGCTMKILSSCEIKGDYDFEETTPARDRIEISDNNELYAKLPLGAASLKGELSAGASLELDYVAVGQRVAAEAPKTRKGQCEGATHYVRTITVGAFKLDARAKGKAGVSAEVGSAGGGISREENSKKLRAQGDVEACVSKPNGPECGAILQLGLAPLAVSRTGQVSTEGFGKGLAPIAEVMEVEDLGDVSLEGTTLAETDIKFLKLVQLAKRSDRQKGIAASTKADAWEAVATYEPPAGKKKDAAAIELATERAKQYRIVAEQEERQRVALQNLKDRYMADREQLNELVALDDDVASPERKAAAKAEFMAVYSTRKDELAMVGIGTIGGSASSDNSAVSSNKSGGSSVTEGTASAESDLHKGVAGFGKLSLELELAMVGGGGKAVTNDGKGTIVAVKDEDFGYMQMNGAVAPGNIMVGVMLATPELIPGGFGFYGAFKAIPGTSVFDTETLKSTMLQALGGVRWDYRATPRGLLTFGAGGGYAFAPSPTRFLTASTLPTQGDFGEVREDCVDVDSIPGEGCPNYVDISPAGPLFDLFAGIGFNNRAFGVQFRAYFQALFLSAGAEDGAGNEIPIEIDGAVLMGGAGGAIGLTF
jgi:hypothetical protein